MMFEHCERRTTDGRRTTTDDGPWVYYKLTYEPMAQMSSKWVVYVYLQVRKFADRSLIYRLQISFNLNLRPFQDYFTHIETSQSVGGGEKIVPQENNLTHSQAELALSHM